MAGEIARAFAETMRSCHALVKGKEYGKLSTALYSALPRDRVVISNADFKHMLLAGIDLARNVRRDSTASLLVAAAQVALGSLWVETSLVRQRRQWSGPGLPDRTSLFVSQELAWKHTTIETELNQLSFAKRRRLEQERAARRAGMPRKQLFSDAHEEDEDQRGVVVDMEPWDICEMCIQGAATTIMRIFNKPRGDGPPGLRDFHAAVRARDAVALAAARLVLLHSLATFSDWSGGADDFGRIALVYNYHITGGVRWWSVFDFSSRLQLSERADLFLACGLSLAETIANDRSQAAFDFCELLHAAIGDSRPPAFAVVGEHEHFPNSASADPGRYMRAALVQLSSLLIRNAFFEVYGLFCATMMAYCNGASDGGCTRVYRDLCKDAIERLYRDPEHQHARSALHDMVSRTDAFFVSQGATSALEQARPYHDIFLLVVAAKSCF